MKCTMRWIGILGCGFLACGLTTRAQKTAPNRREHAPPVFPKKNIQARVLLDLPEGIAAPELKLRVSCIEGKDRTMVAKPTQKGQVLGVDIPSQYAAVFVDIPENPLLNRGTPVRCRCFFERFVRDGSPLALELTEEPVILGLLRVVRDERVQVDLNQKGMISAAWNGTRKAVFYNVELSYYGEGPQRKLMLPVFTCTSRRPRLRIPRLRLARIIRSHSEVTLGGVFAGGGTWSLSGKVREARFSLHLKITGISGDGRPVYSASSGKFIYRVVDPKEIEILRPPAR